MIFGYELFSPYLLASPPRFVAETFFHLDFHLILFPGLVCAWAQPSALEFYQICPVHYLGTQRLIGIALVLACARLAGLTAGQEFHLSPKINLVISIAQKHLLSINLKSYII